MKAIRIHGYGDAPRIEDVPRPEVGRDEVLLRVGAAALNPLEVNLQAGYLQQVFPVTFPFTLGTDFAGTVEEVGQDVKAWRPGDEVVARPHPTRGGGFAEFAAVPASSCAALPPSMTMMGAAGIPTAAGTAWQALFEVAGLKAGQTVLIHAGVGGVGSFAVQLAHAAGARVIATASGDGVELARSLGADQVIDYKDEDFARAVSDVDVVLDLVGGETLTRSFEVLRPGGCLVSTVMPPDEAQAKARGLSASMVFLRLDGDRLKALLDEVHGKSVRVLVDRTLPMARFAEAFQRQASGRARGKIILTDLGGIPQSAGPTEKGQTSMGSFPALRALVVGVAAMAGAEAASAATYSFDTTFENAVTGDTAGIAGFFEVDETSPNYVGGGTTTADDLLDFSLTLSTGAASFTGTPANAVDVGSFDVTFSADLTMAEEFDVSILFRSAGRSLILTLDTSDDGFVQVLSDPFGDDDDALDAFASPAPSVASRLLGEPSPVPLPAGLPLLGAALAGLGFVARRRRR